MHIDMQTDIVKLNIVIHTTKDNEVITPNLLSNCQAKLQNQNRLKQISQVPCTPKQLHMIIKLKQGQHTHATHGESQCKSITCKMMGVKCF